MVCIVPSYNCTFIDCHIIFTSLSAKQIIACVIQVEFLLRAFLKRLYSITYFNKITFNVSTPHVHFWSQIHTNNMQHWSTKQSIWKDSVDQLFFLQQFDHLIKILFTYASVLFFQNMFLRLFRFIENWSNSLFFNNSLYLLFRHKLF